MQVEDVMNDELFEFISTFSNAGGLPIIYVFKVNDVGSATEEEVHFNIAKETMLGAINACAQQTAGLYQCTLHEEVLKIGATKITPEHFFGPYYSFEKEAVIVAGTRPMPPLGGLVYKTFYEFYHNTNQVEANIVDTGKLVADSEYKDWEYSTAGYAQACLHPVHGFRNIKGSIYETGKFFIDMNKFLFSDFTNIIVYSWNTDCSSFFDDGKEWWGHFLWTVYNPEKDWYVGIAVSSTD